MKQEKLSHAWHILTLPDLNEDGSRIPLTDQDYAVAAKQLATLKPCRRCGKQVVKSVHRCNGRG